MTKIFLPRRWTMIRRREAIEVKRILPNLVDVIHLSSSQSKTISHLPLRLGLHHPWRQITIKRINIMNQVESDFFGRSPLESGMYLPPARKGLLVQDPIQQSDKDHRPYFSLSGLHHLWRQITISLLSLLTSAIFINPYLSLNWNLTSAIFYPLECGEYLPPFRRGLCIFQSL